MMLKLAFAPRFPSCVTAEPCVPGCDEITSGATSCQHSIVDLPLAAAVVVKLRCLTGAGAGVGVDAGAAVLQGSNESTS